MAIFEPFMDALSEPADAWPAAHATELGHDAGASGGAILDFLDKAQPMRPLG
jgi:hypothetical protein